MQIVQHLATYNGLADEDPNSQPEHILEKCGKLKISEVSDDNIGVRAFPFSLRGKTKWWLQ